MGNNEGYAPLFETRRAKGRVAYRVFAVSIFLAICMVWIYRATQIPWKEGDNGMVRVGWVAMFAAEIWFTIYWIFTQIVRWDCIYRSTFKDRLYKRHGNNLPGVDVFVCTADPVLEPPIMVINTVLSVMAYDYPAEKLAVYLSDDGGSELTFYAMLEASEFAKHWLPYCRKYNIQTRCPVAYLQSLPKLINAAQAKDFESMKKLYEDMENRIEASTKSGRVSKEVRHTHKGFSKWSSYLSRYDHDTILQILVNGKDPQSKDIDEVRLPTLVYLAREKSPQHFHNYKGGALNALIRVSSIISNGEIILNVDCDMYSNDPNSIQDALCFFMDEKQGHQIAYVQFPQKMGNTSKNDLYAGSFRLVMEVEFHGLDAFGGPIYIGTGCFHRRDTLCGRKFSKDCGLDWLMQNDEKIEGNSQELEEKAKAFASCTYDELNRQWGKEMGIVYGFISEDSVTGLAIQCRGWRSVWFNPKRPGFLGSTPTAMGQLLVQQKRWGEALLQISFSDHSPLILGHNKASLLLRLGYYNFYFWAVNCLSTLCYSTIPSLFLLKGIPLFPEVSSFWFRPFAYIIIATYTYSFMEYVGVRGTVLGWWNEQRMWLYRRTTSYLFAFLDTMLTLLGFSELKFLVTGKACDDDVGRRYESEIMEFGDSCPMFTVLATLALFNLFCFVAGVNRLVTSGGSMVVLEAVALQVLLGGVLILINLPLYEALFVRKDKGRMPMNQTVKSVVCALLAFSCCWLLL